MSDITTTEGLMIYLINTFSERFPQSAILKGGMCLRLLECPRLTNDIDYIFVPYSSKKDIVADVLEVLDGIEGLTYEYNLNSKCLRIRIRYGGLATQIEANVAKECPSTPISTAGVARRFNMLGQAVQVVSFPVAMANKLSAWNERMLVRDLYDLYFYFSMLKSMPDMGVLRRRLSKVASTPRNRNPERMSVDELIAKLRTRLTHLDGEDVLELQDYLPVGEIEGLDTKLRVQLLLFCEQLEKAEPS